MWSVSAVERIPRGETCFQPGGFFATAGGSVRKVVAGGRPLKAVRVIIVGICWTIVKSPGKVSLIGTPRTIAHRPNP